MTNPTEMASTSKSPHVGGALAIAFGSLGLAAGWATADFFCLSAKSGELALRWSLLTLFPLAAAALGSFVSRWIRAVWWAAALRIAGATLVAGGAVGILLADLAEEAVGVRIYGFASGLACALLLVPSFLAIFFVERRAGRARVGSLIGDVDRRAVVAVVAFSIVLAAVAAGPAWFVSALRPERPSPDGPLTFAFLAAAALATMLAVDVTALIAARRALAELEGMSPYGSEAPESAGRVVDLGVGDGWFSRATRPGAAYRGNEEVTAAIHGDPDLAFWVARNAVIRGAVLLAVGTVAIAFSLAPDAAARLHAMIVP